MKVNSFISYVKVIRKATSTIFAFKEKFSTIPLPLRPVLTVQRVWLTAVKYSNNLMFSYSVQ